MSSEAQQSIKYTCRHCVAEKRCGAQRCRTHPFEFWHTWKGQWFSVRLFTDTGMAVLLGENLCLITEWPSFVVKPIVKCIIVYIIYIIQLFTKSPHHFAEVVRWKFGHRLQFYFCPERIQSGKMRRSRLHTEKLLPLAKKPTLENTARSALSFSSSFSKPEKDYALMMSWFPGDATLYQNVLITREII